MTAKTPITDSRSTTRSRRIVAGAGKRFVFVVAMVLALTTFASTMYSQNYNNDWRNRLHEHPALPQCIESVDVASHTLRVLEGIGRRFTTNVVEKPERRILSYNVDAFTQVFINGESKKLEDLEKGMKVYLVVRGNTATRVEVGTKQAGGITSPMHTMQPLSPRQLTVKDTPKETYLGDSSSSLLTTTTHTPLAAGPPRALIDDIDVANRTVTIWGGAFRRPKTCTVPVTTRILINNNMGKFEDLKKGMRVDVMVSPSQTSLSRIEAFDVVVPDEK